MGIILAFAFCKKEGPAIPPFPPTFPPRSVNPAPIARAGKDIFFMLPKNDITLDASASSAADNKINSYQWRRILGPATLTITDSSSKQLFITNMLQGVYDFELTVTDSVGLQGRDTVRVVVGNARLIPVGKLSTKRIVVSIAAAAGKILFAGGFSTNTLSSGRVDIYDTLSGHWTTAELSIARPISIAASGNKIYVSGGDYVYTTDENNVYKANIDIYDAAANSWSVMPFPDGLFLSNLSDQSIAVNDKIILHVPQIEWY